MTDKVRMVCEMNEHLISKMHSAMISHGAENLNTDDCGKTVDMIKDLSEAEEKLMKAKYYATIIEEMEKYDDGREDNRRLGYEHTHVSRPIDHSYSSMVNRTSMPSHHMSHTPYERYHMARRAYTETGRPEDHHKMKEEAELCMNENAMEIREMWANADPEMRKTIKADLTALMNDLIP